MALYKLQRLAQYVCAICMVTILSYSMLRQHAVGRWHTDPWAAGYLAYLMDLFSGDLGISAMTGQPVLQELLTLAPETVLFSLATLVVVILCGPPLGIIAGVTHSQIIRRVIRTAADIGSSLPLFWLGLVAPTLLSPNLDWPMSLDGPQLCPKLREAGMAILPQLGPLMMNQEFNVKIGHLAFMVAVVALKPLSEFIILIQDKTTKVIQQRYVKMAEMRGLSKLTIIRHHLLNSVSLSSTQTIGRLLSVIMTREMLAEVIFGWRGLGSSMLAATRHHPTDYASVSTVILLVGLFLFSAKLLLDMLNILPILLYRRR